MGSLPCHSALALAVLLQLGLAGCVASLGPGSGTTDAAQHTTDATRASATGALGDDGPPPCPMSLVRGAAASPLGGEWRVGDWWQYRDADAGVALHVEVLEEGFIDGTWAQRVLRRWTDARSPDWTDCEEEWRRVEDHALLSTHRAVVAGNRWTFMNESWSPPCPGYWGLRLATLNVTDEVTSACGTWSVGIPRNVTTPAGTFRSIPLLRIDSLGGPTPTYHEVALSDQACGPVQVIGFHAFMELVAFRCTPTRQTPEPRPVHVEPCPDSGAYMRRVPPADGPQPAVVPDGPFLYVERDGGSQRWLLARPTSEVVLFQQRVLRVVVHGNSSSDASGHFPNPPGCAHPDIGHLRAGSGPFERMFDSVGDLQCFLEDGTYDVTEVRFDAAGTLRALDMRFWQACQDPYGKPYELRGQLHWVGEGASDFEWV